MVCPTVKWMMSSVILSLGGCAHPIDRVGAPSAFCELYTDVVVEEGDGAAIAAITRASVKRRILVNEKLSRLCP